jgi:hypothetical protein
MTVIFAFPSNPPAFSQLCKQLGGATSREFNQLYFGIDDAMYGGKNGE